MRGVHGLHSTACAPRTRLPRKHTYVQATQAHASLRSGALTAGRLAGETLVVARGGFGGLGAAAPPSQAPKKQLAQEAQRKSKQLVGPQTG